ncbi:hypothetical protein C0J45_5591, partial [Silurus meridionalis]
LKLNPSKTELLIIPGDSSPGQDLQITLHDSLLSLSATARNLGVTMDNELSFFPHVANVARSCQFLLYNIRRIRQFLSIQAAQMLVQLKKGTHPHLLYYCNALLGGCPASLINKLQLVQNAAARVLTRSRKYDHITPILSSLHWLPVKFRIDYKLLLLTYKALNGLAPIYLSSLLTRYNPPRSLRSQNSWLLVVPR